MSYICPKADNQWYKFNDEIVTKCSANDAIQENYGNEYRSTNAYILVYIRTSCIHEILRDVSVEEITDRSLIEQELTKQVEEFANKHKFYEFTIFTSDALTKNTNLKCGKYLFDSKHGLQIQIEREKSFGDLCCMISTRLGVNEDKTLALWLLNIKKESIRSCDEQSYLNKPLQKLCNKNGGHFYVEILSLKDSAMGSFENNKHALIFIKQYDSKLKQLTFHKHQYILLYATVGDIRTSIENDMNYNRGTQKIEILLEKGSGEEYNCRTCKANESIGQIASKCNGTHSAIIVFEIIDAGYNSEYIRLSQNPSKPGKTPATEIHQQIENGINVVVKTEDGEEYFSHEFYPTDQLLTIVRKLSEIMVSVNSPNILFESTKCWKIVKCI